METHLSIGEVAEQTGLTTHTLRYYERIGLIHAVGRDTGGRRRYAASDLDWIRFLMRLRDTGMPIADMLCYAELRRQGTKTVSERRMLLESHLDGLQSQIERLQEHAGFVADKIGVYRKMERIPIYGTKSGDAQHDHTTTTAALRPGIGKASGNRRRSR